MHTTVAHHTTCRLARPPVKVSFYTSNTCLFVLTTCSSQTLLCTFSCDAWQSHGSCMATMSWGPGDYTECGFLAST